MISLVLPHEPVAEVLTSGVLAKAAAKWLIVGGATAGGTALGPAGVAVGTLAVPAVRAFDP
jgi:hypothetical protein